MPLSCDKKHLLIASPTGLVSTSSSCGLVSDSSDRDIPSAVLEPWITPSLFDQWAGDHSVKDEFSYTKALGKETASSRLDEHWSSWIKEQDLVDIAAAGLNHVRIPVGYWSVTPLPGDPYVSGAYKYLNSSLDWAQKHNLKVMIDLHGGESLQTLLWGSQWS